MFSNYSMNRHKIFVSRNVMFLNCPACHNIGTLHKSKTKNVREIIFKSLFFWTYYRCWECNWRGIMFKKTVEKQSFKVLMFYVLLAIGSSCIVLAILKSIIG